jgi:two-component system response regulator YesN
MKYKVLLIDDEPIIRKGLKNIINWEQFGCEVCGEARDGYQGLKMIESLQPDIVFTDIKMPEMTGLEMLAELAPDKSSAKYIVLTGFRDFEYVKEALILGAFDFLLKPTKLADIKKVVGRAAAELDMQKNKSDMIETLKTRYEQNLPVLREKLLYDIMMGIVTSKDEIDSAKDELGIDIQSYIMLQITAEVGASKLINFGSMHTLSEMLAEEYNIFPVGISGRESVFIVELPDDTEILYGRCLQLQKMMRESFDMHISIAVSEPAKGLSQIIKSYSQCKKAAGLKGMLGDDAFILYSDIKQDSHKYTDARLMGMGRLIVESLTSGAQEADTSCINNLEAEIMKRDSLGDEERKAVLSIIDNMLAEAPYIDFEPDKQGDIPELLGEIREIYSAAADYTIESSQNNMKLVLKKAVEYLEENYCNPLTLRQVADSVYVSPFYISRLFSRQLGKTMTDYLNGIRIKNACELLRDVEYKIYQVGEMVGIPDAHYFSRLFKKHTGMTPSEYRNSLT